MIEQKKYLNKIIITTNDDQSIEYAPVGQHIIDTGNKMGETFNINNTATGQDSHAEGNNTRATGAYSHTEGYKTSASASGAHAEGLETQANQTGAHAEGYLTIASGDYSHAEGAPHTNTNNYTQAAGYAAHAEGVGTLANAHASHSEGECTKAYGANSHAEGQSTQTGSDGDTRFGSAAHSEGQNTLALAHYSHAEGQTTEAKGIASHAEGYLTKAQGNYSHAEGCGIITDEGDIGYSLALGDASHVEGHSTEAHGNYSHAEGEQSIAIGIASHAEGNAYAEGASAHAEGQAKAVGDCSHAEGAATSWAYGRYSHAEGSSTTGEIDTAYGDYAHAEGYNTNAKGMASHAENDLTIARGRGSHAEGTQTQANGNYSHAEGFGTIANGAYQHVAGRYNIPDPSEPLGTGQTDEAPQYLTIVGNGSENVRSNAYTLDIHGNAWYAGNLYLGGNGPNNGVNIKNMLTDIKVANNELSIIQPNMQLPTNVSPQILDKISLSYSHDNNLIQHYAIANYYNLPYTTIAKTNRGPKKNALKIQVHNLNPNKHYKLHVYYSQKYNGRYTNWRHPANQITQTAAKKIKAGSFLGYANLKNTPVHFWYDGKTKSEEKYPDWELAEMQKYCTGRLQTVFDLQLNAKNQYDSIQYIDLYPWILDLLKPIPTRFTINTTTDGTSEMQFTWLQEFQDKEDWDISKVWCLSNFGSTHPSEDKKYSQRFQSTQPRYFQFRIVEYDSNDKPIQDYVCLNTVKLNQVLYYFDNTKGQPKFESSLSII